MMKQLLFSFSTLLLLFLFHCATTLAQSPAQAPAAATPTLPQPPAAAAPTVPQSPAPAAPTLPKSPAPAAPTLPKSPAPAAPTLPKPPTKAPALAGPPDIIKILKKAGHFTLLIRLMKNTQVGDQINSQMKSSNQGLTVFAPTDNAFSNLKSGTLNSLTDEKQVQLLQFHILPAVLSTTQFQTVSNPLRTQAGDTGNYGFPLNVTTSGNFVNVSTGIVNATVTSILYSDNQLAVYEVDKVLLPLNIFGPQPPPSAPAPAPALAKPNKKSPASTTPASTTTTPSSDDTSVNSANSDTRPGVMVSIGVAVIAALSL